MSTASESPAEKTRFENIQPILNVRDIAVSLKYYIDVLGFTRAPWGEYFTSVARRLRPLPLRRLAGTRGHMGLGGRGGCRSALRGVQGQRCHDSPRAAGTTRGPSSFTSKVPTVTSCASAPTRRTIGRLMPSPSDGRSIGYETSDMTGTVSCSRYITI
jgi:hypothetical protein